MNQRRVVITGLGVVSPLGNDIPLFWSNIKEGRSGIRRYEAFDSEDFACKIAGEVRDLQVNNFFRNPKDARRADRFSQLAMAAAKKAVTDSGLDPEKVNRDRIGVMIGSGIGGLQSMEMETQRLAEKGPSRVSPFTITMMISNMASGLVAIEYGFRGPNLAIVTACATATHSIGEAWRMIKFGEADAFVAGGTEATITPIGVAGFTSMKAMSTRNDEPERASRPFDAERDGFVMGEGAGILVIEELEHAKRRGAPIYCELAGYGITCDAHHVTAPLPEGAARCMKIAMDHAGVTPSDISYINAHATSTPVGDISETKALKLALKEEAYKIPVSSTKSMTGHLLGAAGGVETAICALSLKEGVIPPTINLDHPDPECDLDYVPHEAREAKLKVALNNSFGFGGHNASLVLKELE
jgi:3-oxoacyl-[acyl-carrier-protein] synthase II